MPRTYRVELPNGFTRDMRDVGDYRDLVRRLPEDFDGVTHRLVGDWMDGLAVAVIGATAMLEARDRRIRELGHVNARLMDEAQKAAS